uniref:NADH-ubiquinone oxidoreductase chain 1 n=1 Tax=Aelurostrongylus abstrusus TaxID=321389 RepID=K7QGH2_AELAB|nr:NADH dehydrogenase subunit 1 [Aelurostrongylus abstrusus]AFT65554.1 NADH dehydrogenase subunit 1 [Aelurostrongylus abstrusus]
MFLMLLLMVIFILQSVAFITLYERHLLGSSQVRLGPTKVSLMGFFQALLDGLKLLKKEQVLPIFVSDLSFVFVPGVSFFLMYFSWFLLPYFYGFVSLEFSLLFFLCLLGFSVYSTMISGYVSKSKYGMLGALRASSQSVSYEIAFSIYLLCVMMMLGLLVLSVNSGFLFLFLCLPFFVMIVAELNRAPFDFAEGESELVSGYNVEFGSVSFVLLFLSEYGSLIFFVFYTLCCFLVFLFLWFFLIFTLLIFVRSSYPRYRYDLMMEMFWFKFLPVSLVFFLFFFLVGVL